MKTNQPTDSQRPRARWAFSIVEAMVSMAVVGVVFVSLYAGISTGFGVVELARENLRATQILVEKMETIRLYTWDQITNRGFIPTNFWDYYYPSNAQTMANRGIKYSGTMTITNTPFVTTYSDGLKLIIVDLYWTSANVPRHRQTSTLVSRFGLQNYVWN